MITEAQDLIITRLETIEAVKQVDAWQGDIEDLLKKGQSMPALWVIYQGCVFARRKVIGAKIAPQDMRFMIALFNKNLRGRKKGAEACYPIIEAVHEKLIGYQVSTYGWLWPVREDLIHIGSAVLAYGMEYKITTETTGGV